MFLGWEKCLQTFVRNFPHVVLYISVPIRTLCKAVRKSLYSPNNIGNDTLAHIVQISDMVEQRGAQRQTEAETQQVA